jgi:hypothetical protein
VDFNPRNRAEAVSIDGQPAFGENISIPCDSKPRRWYVRISGNVTINAIQQRQRLISPTSSDLFIHVSGLTLPAGSITAPGSLIEVPAGSTAFVGTSFPFMWQAICTTPSCLAVVAFSPVEAEDVKDARHPAWPRSTCPSAPAVYGVPIYAVPPGFVPVPKDELPPGLPAMPSK